MVLAKTSTIPLLTTSNLINTMTTTLYPRLTTKKYAQNLFSSRQRKQGFNLHLKSSPETLHAYSKFFMTATEQVNKINAANSIQRAVRVSRFRKKYTYDDVPLRRWPASWSQLEHRRLQLAKSDKEFKALIRELDESEPRTSHEAAAMIAKIHDVLLPGIQGIGTNASNKLVGESKPTVYRMLRKYTDAVRRLRIAERIDALKHSDRVAGLRMHPNAWRHILSFGPQ